jgi:flap endonuclease-1
MGLQIGELVPRKSIKISELKGKIIAVDAFNTIYQFLSNIRQMDGTPLMDSKGRITSHLSGLFYRTSNLMSRGIKLVFVFDGKPSELKYRTNRERSERKTDAEKKYYEAKKEGKEEDMLKYSRQTVKITDEIIEESKELIRALGLPVIQAPEEGEAQAAFLSKKECFAVASQDYDSLLFGAPNIIQNLTLAKKRRVASGAYIPVEPELIELEKVLNSLQINHEQLICLGILSGTDFNPGGIRGIGPKKALTLVQKYKQPYLIFQAVEKQLLQEGKEMEFDWQEIFSLFKKPNVIKEYKIEFKEFDEEKIKRVLCERHDFSAERVDSALEKLKEAKEMNKQKALDQWFG